MMRKIIQGLLYFLKPRVHAHIICPQKLTRGPIREKEGLMQSSRAKFESYIWTISIRRKQFSACRRLVIWGSVAIFSIALMKSTPFIFSTYWIRKQWMYWIHQWSTLIKMWVLYSSTRGALQAPQSRLYLHRMCSRSVLAVLFCLSTCEGYFLTMLVGLVWLYCFPPPPSKAERAASPSLLPAAKRLVIIADLLSTTVVT